MTVDGSMVVPLGKVIVTELYGGVFALDVTDDPATVKLSGCCRYCNCVTWVAGMICAPAAWGREKVAVKVGGEADSLTDSTVTSSCVGWPKSTRTVIPA